MDNSKDPNDPNAQKQPDLSAKTPTTAEQLTKTIGDAQDVLTSVTAVFPFALFPDTAIVDREKITISHRTFFRTAEVISIRIHDILNVTADIGPMFGSVKIHTRFFDPDKPYAISFLKRRDALRLKRILQGYVIAIQKGIDCSSFDVKQLATLLDELG
jgi:hypothetical protein